MRANYCLPVLLALACACSQTPAADAPGPSVVATGSASDVMVLDGEPGQDAGTHVDGAEADTGSDASDDAVADGDDAALPDAASDTAADAPDAPGEDTGPDAGETATGADVTDAKDASPSCVGTTLKPDGSCCPDGGSWHPGFGKCVFPGLPECPGTGAPDLACEPATCTSDGDKGCKFPACGEAFACAEADFAKGCAPGSWRPAPGAPCRLAGTDIELPDGTTLATAADLKPPAALPPLPPLPALPPVTPPVVCVAADGTVAACAVGGCPVGEVKGGQGCIPQPVSGPCPAGFVAGAIAKGGTVAGCLPDAKTCGSDAFGGVADGPGLQFVDAKFVGKPDGTRKAPWPTLPLAIAAAQLGHTVVLAAGKYAGASVTKSLTLRGKCAAEVTLVGTVSVHSALFAGVQVSFLRDITVGPGHVGVRVEGGAKLTLERVHIAGASRAGLMVTGKSEVSATDLVVEGTQAQPSDKKLGVGLWLLGGTITLNHAYVIGNRDHGLYAEGTPTTVDATDLQVHDTQARAADAENGHGITVVGGATAVFDQTRLAGNRTWGVGAYGLGTAVTATDLTVTGTLAQASDQSGGLGVVVGEGAALDLRLARLQGNRDTGLEAGGKGTWLLATGLLVQGTLPRAKDKAGGEGLVVAGGAQATLAAVRLQGNRTTGLLCSGATLTATGLLVDGTLSRESDLGAGYGLRVEGACQATVKDGRIHGNRTTGVVVTGEPWPKVGSQLIVDGLVVDGTLSRQSSLTDGAGMRLQVNANIQAKGLRLSGNRTVGLHISGPKLLNVTASLADTLIDGTLAQEKDGSGGTGLVVGYNVSSAGALRVSGNRDTGIRVEGGELVGPVGSATNTSPPMLLVDGTLPRADGYGGRGLVVDGGKFLFHYGRFSGNHDVGVIANGMYSVVLSDVIIDTMLPRKVDGKSGRCFEVVSGSATLKNVNLVGCLDAGLVLTGKSWIDASSILIAQVQPRKSDGNYGRGLVIQDGAAAYIGKLRVHAAHDVAIFVHGAGSKLEAMYHSVIIDGTLPLADGSGGRGLEVGGGATAHLGNALFRLNRDVGILVADPGSTVHLRATAILDTLAKTDGKSGRALVIQGGANATGRVVRVLGAAEFGVQVDASNAILRGLRIDGGGKSGGVWLHAGSTLSLQAAKVVNCLGVCLGVRSSLLDLTRSVLGNATASSGQPGGDVLLARKGAIVLVDQAMLLDSVRTGALLDTVDPAVFARTRISGHAVGVGFGGGTKPTFPGGVVAGNTVNLQADKIPATASQPATVSTSSTMPSSSP